MTSTPGFSSNWTRFWLRALKRISTTWWNNKRYGSHNKEDFKLWRTFGNACGQWMVANISYWLQEEKWETDKVERNMFMWFRQNWVLLHASLSPGFFRLTEHVVIFLLGSKPRKLIFFFFLWKHRWGGKQWRIFSPFTMSCKFDLMHLEIADLLPFHWWMTELSEAVQPSNTYLHLFRIISVTYLLFK